MSYQNSIPAPTFNRAFSRAKGYTLATPYGTVHISEDGRRVSFTLYEDVRQSMHHRALFSYYQALRKRGIEICNVDHLDLPDLDRTLSLIRGNARLDLVYMWRGKIHEVELKTHREVGLDRTRIQLTEVLPHCQNLIVVVPLRDLDNMQTILSMIGLSGKITVDTYEIFGEEDNGYEG